MSELGERRRAAVRKLFELFSTGRWAQACDDLLAPAARWAVFPSSVAGERTLEEHRRYLGEIMKDYETFHIVPTQVVGGGADSDDIVYCAAKSQATHRHMGKYGQDYIFAFTFRAGSSSILHVKEFVDSLYSAKFFARAAKAKAKL